jgi:hypothetical protein
LCLMSTVKRRRARAPTLALSMALIGNLAAGASVAQVSNDHGHVAGSAVPQLSDEAWWTGSLLSASAATMPVGRWLVEPYMVDVITDGYYDAAGSHHRASRVENVGTAAYIMYGLIDGLSVGALPRLTLRQSSSTQGGSGLAPGDLTLMSQFRLTPFREGGWIPATSLVLGETLPAGRYDRLSGGPNAGTGRGVHRTEVSLYAQTILRSYRDRPLRARLNLTYAWSDSTSLNDVSVYGTPVGFRGRAQPGAAFTAVSAWEYSVTPHWVLALDVVYEHQDNTRVVGYVASGAGAAQVLRTDSGPSEAWSFAPAVEYNFNSNIGIIAGVQFTGWGRNTASVLVPAVAVNMFF